MKEFSEYLAAREGVNLRDASLFESAFLYKEMAVLNPNAISKSQSALNFIKQHKIQGVLVGGIAVSHYTADRALTPDIDFLVADFDGLKRYFDEQGIKYQPLASTEKNLGIHVPEIDTDFLNPNSWNPQLLQYALKTGSSARIGGVNFPIIDPAVLAIVKFNIGRDKDMDDAFKLLAVVSKEAIKTHLKALKSVLRGEADAKTIWSYASHMSS